MNRNNKKWFLLFSVVVILLNSINFNVNALGNTYGELIEVPFSYSVLPGSEEWSAFNDVEEKRNAIKVDKEILDRMTTEALVETVIKYPLLVDIYAYNTIEEGISHLSDYFQGVDVLMTRSDAVDELEAYVDRKELMPGDVELIYINSLISYITPSLEEIIFGDDLNYTNSSVTTPNGSTVPTLYNMTWADHGTTQTNAEAINNIYLSAYSSATYGGAVNPAFNCHSFAWYSQSTTNKHWMNSPSRYFTDMSYTMTSSYSVGNRITYTTSADYDHSGIIYSISGSTPYVKSKWGYYGIFIHKYNDCPYYSSATYIRYWH